VLALVLAQAQPLAALALALMLALVLVQRNRYQKIAPVLGVRMRMFIRQCRIQMFGGQKRRVISLFL
jgi:hypothetical protein